MRAATASDPALYDFLFRVYALLPSGEPRVGIGLTLQPPIRAANSCFDHFLRDSLPTHVN